MCSRTARRVRRRCVRRCAADWGSAGASAPTAPEVRRHLFESLRRQTRFNSSPTENDHGTPRRLAASALLAVALRGSPPALPRLLSVMLLDSAFIQENDWTRAQRKRGHGAIVHGDAHHSQHFACCCTGGHGHRGGKAKQIRVTATITAEKGSDGIRIRSSHLQAIVEGLENIQREMLREIAQATEEGCTISIAIRGSVAISSAIETRLLWVQHRRGQGSCAVDNDAMKTLLLFVATALAEIVGCYLPYLWLKQGRRCTGQQRDASAPHTAAFTSARRSLGFGRSTRFAARHGIWRA
jgi:hypothetical protein